jgi:hypothetical protein
MTRLNGLALGVVGIGAVLPPAFPGFFRWIICGTGSSRFAQPAIVRLGANWQGQSLRDGSNP